MKVIASVSTNALTNRRGDPANLAIAWLESPKGEYIIQVLHDVGVGMVAMESETYTDKAAAGSAYMTAVMMLRCVDAIFDVEA